MVSLRARLFPDSVAVHHEGVAVSFGSLERTAAGLRAAVPALRADPDAAVRAAVAALAPLASAALGRDLSQRITDAAGERDDVADAFGRVVAEAANRVAITSEAGDVTFAELDRSARALAARYSAEGIGRGSTIAVPAVESVATAATIVGLAYVGATAVFGTTDSLPSNVDLAGYVLAVPDGDGWCGFDDVAVRSGCRALWPSMADSGPTLWWHLADTSWGPLEFWATLLRGLGLVVVDREIDPIDQCRRYGVATVLATVHDAVRVLRSAEHHEDLSDSVRMIVDHPLATAVGGAIELQSVSLLPWTFGPLDPTHVVVLDRRLRRVPAGVIGDLYVTGDATVATMLDVASRVSTRLVASPVSDAGATALRTGKGASVDTHGIPTVTGDRESVVLRRGVRVDTVDVAARLRALPWVVDAVALAVFDEVVGVRVVAYVQLADSDAGAASTADRLREDVPDYAAPDAVLTMARIPLGRNGRVDRDSLPALEPWRPPSVDDTAASSSRSSAADLIHSVFADLLGIAAIGSDQSFFDLGGSSLSATKAIARINAASDVRLRVADIFDAPTPRGLARVIDRASAANGTVDFADVVNTVRPERIPVAPTQLRLWVLSRVDPESTAYNVPLVLQLSGSVDLGALAAALGDVVARHEILRTTFPDDGDGPVLRVETGFAPELPIVEVDAGGEVDAVTAIVGAPFDVTAAPPVRAAVVRRSDVDHVLVVCVHHLVMDGESLLPLAADLATAYAARVRAVAPLWADPAPQYVDYARWQHRLLGTPEAPTDHARRQLEYWKGALHGLPDTLDLPVDRSRMPLRPDVGAGEVRRDVPASVHETIDRFARAHEVSEHMVLLAAYAVAVARWTGATDFAVGIATAGRTDPALDTAIGTFVGTVALRTTLHPADAFVDVVQQVRRTAVAAYDNADVPFDRVVEAADRGGAPLYRIGFAYRAARSDVTVTLPGLRASIPDVDVLAAKDDLLFTAESSVDDDGHPSGIALSLVYASALFHERTIDAFATLVRTTLVAAVANSETPVLDLDLLGDDERTRILGALRGPSALVGGANVLPDMLASSALTHSDRVAVRMGDASVTYRELYRRSCRLARTLIARGAGPETLVAVSFSRSIDMVLAVWAVAASGAAYVPMDAAYPPARLRYMVSDSGVTLGLARREQTAALPETVQWIDIDDEWTRGVDGPECDPITDAQRLGPVRPTTAAYMIYTSGSTGLPKGVVVTHMGLSGLAAETRGRFATTSASRPAQTASPSFDPYVMDMLIAALPGAELVVVPPDLVGGDPMTEYLAEHRVTHLSSTPGVVATLDPDRLPLLEMVAVGGEPLAPSLRDAWSDRVRLVNVYGPTETTVASHFSEPDRIGAPVNIGRSIVAMGCAVLDARLHPVADGAVGELYLFGAGLARGYRSSTPLTSTRFVASPFPARGERMYRTGDLVRAVVSEDGGTSELRYAGRVDAQIKVRGIRVEPGEVDAVLLQRPSIAAVITVGRPGPSGDTALVSYYVPTHDDPGAATVKASLIDELPPHLVPALMIPLARLPLTPNGKVDRAALPEPEFAVRGHSRAARSDTERAVLATFADVLGDTTVGVEDDFFGAGGNSLSATRVVSRIGRDLGRRIGVRALFDAPTAEQLAALLDATPAEIDGAPALTDVVRPERVPLSYAQTRMWFANVFDAGGSDDAGAPWNATAYNVPLVVRVTGPLDTVALGAAVADVVERHEVLRTRFPDSDTGPFQDVLPASSVPIDVVAVPIADEDVLTAVVGLVTTRFDVTAAPPIAMRLWRIEDGDAVHVFGLVVHHVCTDGESMQPLVRDLVSAYAARVDGHRPRFTPLPVQYADFAVWQRLRSGDENDATSAASRGLAYWRDALAGIPDAPVLSTDRPRPVVASLRSDTVPVALDAEIHRGVLAIAESTGATPFMVVHSAVAVFLSRWGSSPDVVVGTPVAGRGDRDLDDLVGMFVGTVALRTTIDPAASFLDTVRSIRAADLDAFSHSETPFERVVDALAPVRSTAHHPIFQTMLSFQNLAVPGADIAGVHIEPLDVDPGTSQYDLHLVVAENVEADGSPAGLPAALTFATDLFDRDTAHAMARSLEALIASVLANADRPVGDADLMSADDIASLLAVGHRAPPTETTLASVLEESYRHHAESVAVVDGDRRLTYAQVGHAVRARRDELVEMGVGPESVVAVELSRSLELVIEIQAVVLAGAAYLPIDPTLPEDRRSVIRAAERRTAAAGLAGPANPAYVIFTSGSTGAPKGVVVSHGAICAQLRWLQGEIPLDSRDVVLWRTSASFDLSVWELWWPMVAGATLVVGPPGCERDPAALADVLRSERVSVTTFVPSLLAAFLGRDDAAVREGLTTVRNVLCIGEALPATTAARCVALGADDLTVHNLYGPTEAAVSITHHRVAGVSR